MSSVFQGLTDEKGIVTVSSATPPGDSLFFRGIRVSPSGTVYVVTDAGQERNFIGGVAVEAGTGRVLRQGTATPYVYIGGMRVDQNGAVRLNTNPPEVIHQGVGLLNQGDLCVFV